MPEDKNGAPAFIEKALQQIIPGYKGYYEAGDIIEADAKIREHIIAGLEDMRSRIDARKKEFSASLQTANSLAVLESVTAGLKTAAEALRYSAATAPEFNFSSFDASKCDKLKAYDEYLYFSMQEIKSVIDSLCASQSQADINACASRVSQWSEKYLSQIKSRGRLL